MSIATEIARIQQDVSKIRAKLNNLGLASEIDKLTSLANAISTIANNGAVKIDVKEGETYNIPAGYHNGSGTVSGVAGGGNYTLQLKEVTPTKEQQSIKSDEGYYGLSSVTVKAIPSIYQDVSVVTATAADVIAQRIFVASDGTMTVGTMPDNGAINSEIDGLSAQTSVTIAAGYTSGGTVRLADTIENALKEI